MKSELNIIIRVNDDESLDVEFDGTLHSSRQTRCLIVSSIIDALHIDLYDAMYALAMNESGAFHNTTTGEHSVISLTPPEDFDDDDA